MSEHVADPNDLDAREAAQEIGRLQEMDDALARRTAGLTWVIWGIVAPAIFASYGAFAGAQEALGPAYNLVWVPWTVLGAVATWALWETTGTVVPVDRGRVLKALAGGLVLFIAAVYLAMGTASALGVSPEDQGGVPAVAGLGGATLAASAAGFLVPEGSRRLFAASGALLVVGAVATVVALANVEPPLLYALSGFASMTLVSVAFVVPGLIVARGG